VLLGCRDDSGRLVGILPLARQRVGPLRLLRFLGHGAGDQLGPICAPPERAGVAEALRSVLASATLAWDVLVGEHLPAEEGWSASLGARVLTREPSPVVTTGGLGWDDFLRARSANFRQQVRRLEGRLIRDRALRYRLADDPQRLDADLDVLFALHRARWAGAGIDAFAGPRGDLHRAFARRALSRGWLRLWIAELDGRPAAAWYGLRFADVEWYYQAGRDPEQAPASIGFVLMAHTLREAIADRVSEYRLLRGGEEFKRRFATRDAWLETVAVGRGARGAAALTGLRALAAAPPALRRLVRRSADGGQAASTSS
jgi:CelD/BcsL family acetyltransferase involved in cellulose biosynthesis